MVPQQAHYQFRWLNVFEHTWACPFAICYLLFAISAVSTLHTLAIGYPLPVRILFPFTAFPAFTYE